jgi:hypothetical protein
LHRNSTARGLRAGVRSFLASCPSASGRRGPDSRGLFSRAFSDSHSRRRFPLVGLHPAYWSRHRWNVGSPMAVFGHAAAMLRVFRSTSPAQQHDHLLRRVSLPPHLRDSLRPRDRARTRVPSAHFWGGSPRRLRRWRGPHRRSASSPPGSRGNGQRGRVRGLPVRLAVGHRIREAVSALLSTCDVDPEELFGST